MMMILVVSSLDARLVVRCVQSEKIGCSVSNATGCADAGTGATPATLRLLLEWW